MIRGGYVRTSQDQLKADLGSFLVAYDYSPSDIGNPICPLCNDHWKDYRALSDEEIQQAWKAAAQEHNRTFGENYNPEAPCWKGIFCCENWREVREALEKSKQIK